MFEGTKSWFSFLYFITAMLPAYLLLVLQLDLGKRVINYLFIFGITLIGFLIGIFLRKKIKQRCKEGPTLINQEIRIKDKNGNVITFLFGVVTPSLLLPEKASCIEQIVVTICIQLGCYFIVKNSSDIIPNILLIFLHIDVYISIEGNYLVTINHVLTSKEIKGNICRLGDTSLTNVFILINGEKE